MPRRRFPRLCSSFLCAHCSKKLQKRAPTKTQLRVLSIIDQLRVWGTSTIHLRSIKSSLPFSLPLCHVINDTRPSPTFPHCKRWKAGRSLGARLAMTSEEQIMTSPRNVLAFWAVLAHFRKLLFLEIMIDGDCVLLSNDFVSLSS